MTLFERLQAHEGGLVRIRSQLYWYYDRGWDGVPGRLCLVLDATAVGVATAAFTVAAARLQGAAALLLVDGAPHWVWVVAKDIELLDGGDR